MTIPTVELTGSALGGIMPTMRSVSFDQPETVKLGRIRPPALPQVPRFAAYFDEAAVTPPKEVDYTKKAMSSLNRMYMNDRLGCCVISGKYHAVGVWSGNDTDSAILGSDNEIVNMYRTICGPGDRGCLISSVLDYMKARGMPFNGVRHKIDGYVTVNNQRKIETQIAILLFGHVTIGFNLPQSWTSESKWDITTSPIVGGHDVCLCGYNEEGVIVSSWGRLYLMTWQAYISKKYVEEAYVILAPSWYNDDKLSPNGVDVTKLRDDLQKIGSGIIPTIDPPEPEPIPLGDDIVIVDSPNKMVTVDHDWTVIKRSPPQDV